MSTTFGYVSSIAGTFTVKHLDGTKAVLAKGDIVSQGDVVEANGGIQLYVSLDNGEKVHLDYMSKLMFDTKENLSNEDVTGYELINPALLSGLIDEDIPEVDDILTAAGDEDQSAYVAGGGLLYSLGGTADAKAATSTSQEAIERENLGSTSHFDTRAALATLDDTQTTRESTLESSNNPLVDIVAGAALNDQVLVDDSSTTVGVENGKGTFGNEVIAQDIDVSGAVITNSDIDNITITGTNSTTTTGSHTQADTINGSDNILTNIDQDMISITAHETTVSTGGVVAIEDINGNLNTVQNLDQDTVVVDGSNTQVDTGASTDVGTVTGSDNLVVTNDADSVTVQGSDTIITTSSSTTTGEISGTNTTINTNDGDEVIATGDNNTIIAGAQTDIGIITGDTTSVSVIDNDTVVNTGNNGSINTSSAINIDAILSNDNTIVSQDTDIVSSVSNNTIILTEAVTVVDTISGDDNTIIISDADNIEITGDHNIASSGAQTTLGGTHEVQSLTGDRNTITVSDEDQVTIIQGNSNTVSMGTNTIVGVIANTAQDNTIDIHDNDDVTINGSDNSATLGAISSISDILGTNNTISIEDKDNADVVGDRNEIHLGSQTAVGEIATTNSISVDDSDTASITGNDNIITTAAIATGIAASSILTSDADRVEISGNRNSVDTGMDSDTIIVAGDENTLNAGTGDDTITITSGDRNRINGGAGNDTVTANGTRDTFVLNGNKDDFTITHNTDGSYTITDTVGNNGSDTISGVEFIVFNDGTYTPTDLLTPTPTDFSLVVSVDDGHVITHTTTTPISNDMSNANFTALNIGDVAFEGTQFATTIEHTNKQGFFTGIMSIMFGSFMTVQGTDNNDLMLAVENGGINAFYGGAGDDIIGSNTGENDGVNGGSGNDIALYDGNIADYHFEFTYVGGDSDVYIRVYEDALSYTKTSFFPFPHSETVTPYDDVQAVEVLAFKDAFVTVDYVNQSYNLITEVTTSVDTYEYVYTTTAILDDANSTLSSVTLDNIPNGVTVTDSADNTLTANADGSYTIDVTSGVDSSVKFVFGSEVDSGFLQTVTSSVTATNNSSNVQETLNTTLEDDTVVLTTQTTLDTGAGNDTLVTSNDIDFDTLSLNNVETIELSTGAQVVSNLNVDDVFQTTDTNNILVLEGDTNDSVTLNSEWTNESSITNGEGAIYDIYTGVSNGETVTLQINQEIVVDNIA